MEVFRLFEPVNPEGEHVYATVASMHEGRETRASERRFHGSCFAKFEAAHGRPYNPSTHYEVNEAALIRDDSETVIR